MRLPFTLDEFLDLFRSYNEAVGIAPTVLAVMAIVAVALMFSPFAWRHAVVSGLLAALAIWSGVVYHWLFFTRINPAAWVFGLMFIALGGVLAYAGVLRRRVVFVPSWNVSSTVGALLIVYALVAYRILGEEFGHGYPSGPSFGAPCPTTIFLIGMGFFAISTLPRTAIALVVLWAAVGTSAAVQLGMREDFGLGIGAILLLIEVALRRFQRTYVAGAATRHAAAEASKRAARA